MFPVLLKKPGLKQKELKKADFQPKVELNNGNLFLLI
jgi:hypothetical protein